MRILVIVAHPDDEVLGCGGAIAKHVLDGDLVHVEILAEGVNSRLFNKSDRNSSAITSLRNSARKANEILGVTSLAFHDYPDNRMDSIERLDIIKFIEKKIISFRPEVVYTHHSGDVNIDHKIIHDCVVTACRPLPGQSVHTLLYFEIPSSTDWQTANSGTVFMPNWFVDIGRSLQKKTDALEAYHAEMRPWPHARSITAINHLARWRGATVGVEAAEAFVLGRLIR